MAGVSAATPFAFPAAVARVVEMIPSCRSVSTTNSRSTEAAPVSSGRAMHSSQTKTTTSCCRGRRGSTPRGPSASQTAAPNPAASITESQRFVARDTSLAPVSDSSSAATTSSGENRNPKTSRSATLRPVGGYQTEISGAMP